jgi:hypothetical protein
VTLNLTVEGDVVGSYRFDNPGDTSIILVMDLTEQQLEEGRTVNVTVNGERREDLQFYFQCDQPEEPDLSIVSQCTNDGAQATVILDNRDNVSYPVTFNLTSRGEAVASDSFDVPSTVRDRIVTLNLTAQELAEGRTINVTVNGKERPDLQFRVQCERPIDTENITLTAICTDTGDDLARYRIRNDNDQEVTVNWDVYGTSQGDEVTVGANSEETFVVETDSNDEATVRLSYDGDQIGVKANNPDACDLGEPNEEPIDPADIRLTAICTDSEDDLARYRIRNDNDQEVTVNWDVYGTSQGDEITVGANSDEFIVVNTSGSDEATVRLFYDGNQIDVKANDPNNACDLGDPNEEPEPSSVVFNGCGNAIITAPGLSYPVTVQVQVFNPGMGQNSGYQTTTRQLGSSGGSVASPGGKMVAIEVPGLGAYQNPTFDENAPSARCPGGEKDGESIESFPPFSNDNQGSSGNTALRGGGSAPFSEQLLVGWTGFVGASILALRRWNN